MTLSAFLYICKSHSKTKIAAPEREAVRRGLADSSQTRRLSTPQLWRDYLATVLCAFLLSEESLYFVCFVFFSVHNASAEKIGGRCTQRTCSSFVYTHSTQPARIHALVHPDQNRHCTSHVNSFCERCVS